MCSVYSLNHLPNNGKVHNKLSETSEKADSITDKEFTLCGLGTLGEQEHEVLFAHEENSSLTDCDCYSKSKIYFTKQ